MLSEEDKTEIRKIALESNKIEIYRFRIKLMKLLDKDRYLNWSSAAQEKFIEDGTIEMIEDLDNLLNFLHDSYKSKKDGREKLDDDWESLESEFLKKYEDYIKEK